MRRVLTWVVVVLLLVGVGWWLAETDAPVSGNCNDVAEEPSPAGAEATQERASPVALELAPDSDTSVDFRLRRKARRTSVFLQRVRSAGTEQQGTSAETTVESTEEIVPMLPEPGSRLKVDVVDLERDGGDIELDPAHIRAEATVRNNREGVRLTVCVDPEAVPPGRYQGSIVFDDARVTAGAVQWTVTLQYEKWWFVAFAALAVVAAAFFYAYATTGGGSSQSPEGVLAFAKDNFMGVAAGLTAATVSFISAYWGSLDWGGDPDDWLKGAGVVFTAFITGFLAQRLRSPKGQQPPARDAPQDPTGTGGGGTGVGHNDPAADAPA
jgi:hypothetical protein